MKTPGCYGARPGAFWPGVQVLYGLVTGGRLSQTTSLRHVQDGRVDALVLKRPHAGAGPVAVFWLGWELVQEVLGRQVGTYNLAATSSSSRVRHRNTMPSATAPMKAPEPEGLGRLRVRPEPRVLEVWLPFPGWIAYFGVGGEESGEFVHCVGVQVLAGWRLSIR